MKKFVNNVDDMLAESLSGFAAIHGDIVALGEGNLFVRRAMPDKSKVAVISGGGSGHEPLHAGFIGTGMLDAACPGHVFTSPTPDQMLAAINAVAGDPGVLLIVKNYAGDRMNFEMAVEMAEGKIATVVTDDDVAVENSTYTTGRRGVAGTMIVEKMVGALAETRASLEDCRLLGVEVNARTRSMGVALTSCTVPAAGRPTFDIDDTEMEMGVGIHGEPGRRRVPLGTARSIAEEMISTIVADLKLAEKGQGPAILLVNGFGATPLLELYLMAEMARAELARHGITIARGLVGNYVTSLDMAGCSLTVSMVDDRLLRLWDAPVHTAALHW
ncbi:MAG: dihydroxyacetone kinase subunit DhaK [Azospirillaceae bacterium]|nr:dihydroxyacetone kinase subunit DhaK [Azospirillaceae bacterium]